MVLRAEPLCYHLSMTIVSIYAQLSCSDIEQSKAWYRILFDREPDANPMDGLLEWHHEKGAGFQLFANLKDAGHGSMTIIVSGLIAERQRLLNAGHQPSEIGSGDVASICQLSDPDGNLVVLAEPTT